MMFDLRSNFTIKVDGKEDYTKQTAKQDRTTFLCVNIQVFQRLFQLFPKSKIVVQKRALERRRVFMDQLEKMEKFLKRKDKKMKKLQKRRMLAQQKGKLGKNFFKGGKAKNKENKTFNNLERDEDICSSSSSSGEDSENDKQMMGQMLSNSDSELSNDNMNNSQLGGNKHISSMMTGFDDDISKSIDDKNFQITERALDEEQAAKEEYMRKLMSFRKDELLLPDESENDEEDDDSTGFKNNK